MGSTAILQQKIQVESCFLTLNKQKFPWLHGFSYEKISKVLAGTLKNLEEKEVRHALEDISVMAIARNPDRGLQQYPDGLWGVDCRIDGKRVREKIGTKDKARERYQDLSNLNRRARRGEDITAGPTARMPEFSTAVEQFMSTVQDHRSVRDYRRNALLFKHLWGKHRLDEITPVMVEVYKSTRLKSGRKPATVNRELAWLKRCFNVAILELEASSATRHLARKVINPMHHVRMLKENNERNRFLSREEQEILRRFLPVWLYLAMVVAIATGIRRENLFSMRRDQIDWDRRILRLPLTKDGYQQAVFLNEDALNALREQLGSHDLEWVWPNHGGMSPVQAGNTYTRIWLPALKEAGLAHITWHDLKHTTAQRLIEEGGQDLYTVQVLLNIKDPKTANRYAALSEKHLRNAIESTVKTDAKLPRRPQKPRKTR